MDSKKNQNKSFHMVLFDMNGNIVYPNEKKEISIVTHIMKHIVKDDVAFDGNEQKWYNLKEKNIELDGKRYRSLSIIDITDYIDEISHASYDEITNLSTRRAARDLFISYIEHAYINKENFAVIMADMDHFKEINDTYGHIAGDRVLKSVSNTILSSIRHDSSRDNDIVARLGGDEFVVILKDISENYAENRAEQIRKEVDDVITDIGMNQESHLIKTGTMSVGLYYVPWEDLDTLYSKGYTLDEIRIDILNKCDAVLYISKNNGKNKVTSYSKGPIKKLV